MSFVVIVGALLIEPVEWLISDYPSAVLTVGKSTRD